jgi:hypothetical protein
VSLVVISGKFFCFPMIRVIRGEVLSFSDPDQGALRAPPLPGSSQIGAGLS